LGLAWWQGPGARAAARAAGFPVVDADGELRKLCMARIKTRLKRISAKKNAGLALFDLSDYLACLMVIESRN
jgi:hypothetical protein